MPASEYKQKLRELEFSVCAQSRSLLHCKQILQHLGFSVVAVSILCPDDIVDDTILYLPSGSVGHAVVVSPDGGGWYSVFDPSEANSCKSIQSEHMDIGPTLGVRLRRVSEARVGTISVVVAGIVCVIFLGVFKMLRIRKLNAYAITCLLIKLLFTGCNDSPVNSSFQSNLSHDFGVIEDRSGISRISHVFTIWNSSGKDIEVLAISSSWESRINSKILNIFLSAWSVSPNL